jgi:hypothetical protein
VITPMSRQRKIGLAVTAAVISLALLIGHAALRTF